MKKDRSSIQRYPAYKDSGIEWLGKVPKKWPIVRNKEIFEERSSLSTTGKETLLTVSHITGVTPRSEKNVNMFMAETMEGYKICHQGDLVINTMWAWMGALGTSNELGICSPAYNVYKPIKGIPYNYKYFDYFFRTPNSIVEMTRNSKGIVSSRLRLYAKDFFKIETVLPSLEEQKSIAHYLDTKTAQIDRKIDLLTQKATQYGNLKQSLINEAVTRGLDKSVPMKDSGIEAIGEVPEHWGEKRIKDLSFLQSGINITSEQIEEIGQYPVYGGNGLRGYFSKYTNDGHYILIGRQGALCGNINYASGKFWATEHAVVAYLKCSVDMKWYGEILRMMNLNKYSLSAAQPGLAVDRIKRLLLFVPPLSEQKAIAHYLDTKTTQIDQIIQTINTQIEKLKELRKTLINDVVTGKIRVIEDDPSSHHS
jgi:type I restriction enzyme, S subunit